MRSCLNPALLVCMAMLLPGFVIAQQPVAEAVALVRQAEQDLAAERGKAAVEKLQQAARIQPDWHVPASRLAVLYQAAGMDAAALQQYLAVQLISHNQYQPNPEKDPALRAELAETEAYMLMQVNAVRARAGLRLLYPHPQLAVIGRQHAREMRDLDYFSHESPTPARRTILDRFKLVLPFRPTVLAENLSKRWRTGYGYSLSLANVRQSHEDLLRSPGHRANIHRADVIDFGIGVASNYKGDYWLAQIFVDMSGHPEY